MASSKDDQLVKKWIGGGTGNKTVEKIVDPLGIGDAFFGEDPEMADTSDWEKDRANAMQSWEDSMPTSYEDTQWQSDYNPELIGELPQLSDSEMSDISTDPRYQKARLQALSDLEQQASDGLSAQDKADLAKAEGNVNRQNAGRLGAIQQNMAARGMSGSGMEMLANMQAAQDATQQNYQNSLDKEAMSQNGRRDASSRLGSLGSSMQAQDFSQQAAQAQAQDAINRFNTQNSVNASVSNNQTLNDAAKYNNAGKQSVANTNTAGHNNYAQQQFNNQGQVSQLKYNAATNDINGAKQDYQNAVDSKQKKKDGIINTATSIAGAAAAFSDENLKDDIKSLDDSEIEDFLRSLQPKGFKYKNPEHGEGERVGILAQDMERSKMGKKLVKDTPEGKAIDINNTIGALLDAVAHLNRKIK